MAIPTISATQQRKIEVMLTKWSGKLTWEALVAKVDLELGLKTTRQTLYTYTGINASYKKRKAQLRGATPALYTKITASDVKLLERIENLEAENEILTRNNSEQLRMIERMLANAKSIPNLDLGALIQRRPEETKAAGPRIAKSNLASSSHKKTLQNSRRGSPNARPPATGITTSAEANSIEPRLPTSAALP